MSAEQLSSLFSQGTTKTYQIPIEHLDYQFIETCSDVKYLERILRILRSGEEGWYPDLNLFCEKRIETLAPNSRALRREKPAATAFDFSAEEWKQINDEIQNWVTEMKTEEYKISYGTTEVFKEEETFPPVRSSSNCNSTNQNKALRDSGGEKKNIPRDYREWDKFDVEKECSKIDGNEENHSKASFKTNRNLPKNNINTTGMTSKEKSLIANHEREKGNEAFIIGDYKEAIAYYTRSISAFPTVAAYNNKAQAEIKLENWKVALQDCETVLKMDPENIKALMRRATIYTNLHNFKEAVEDLSKVLQTEPGNAIAKKKLLDIEKNMKVSEPVSQTEVNGKKIPIEDIEESESDEEQGHEAEHKSDCCDKKTPVLVGGGSRSEKATEMGNAQKKFPSKGEGCKAENREGQRHKDPSEHNVKKNTSEKNKPKGCENQINGYLSKDESHSENKEVKLKNAESSTGKSGSVLVPSTAAALKAEGNELFRNGQFGEAVLKYSEAIENAISSGNQSPEDLSILYSNRAACYLKEGNSTECIQDCNRALELHPYSLKPLLRRAMAYESMERYRQAYVDYKTLLQIDSGIQAANDSVNRITRTLIDQDGPNWREKLPQIPVVPVSAQLHCWDRGSVTSETKQTKPTIKPGVPQTAIPSENPEEMFKSLKNQGNEFVKNGRYREALMKYKECMKLNPNDKTLFTNRALCCLKLFQYEEAKKDCDYVLQTDGSNIKALYRRALAYKGLQNYKASMDDLNKVLQIDPTINEAKKELKEITELFKLQSEVTGDGQQNERKKIEIQEVSEYEEEAEAETLASQNAAVNHQSAEGKIESIVPSKGSEKVVIAKPSNAYEFGQIVNVVNANKDIAGCAKLLEMIEPKDLPILLSNKLEGDIFVLFIQALQSDVICQDPGLVYQHLVHLSKAERFKMALSLLSTNEMEHVRQLFDSLSKESNQQFSLGDLESLKRDFEL